MTQCNWCSKKFSTKKGFLIHRTKVHKITEAEMEEVGRDLNLYKALPNRGYRISSGSNLLSVFVLLIIPIGMLSQGGMLWI